MPAPVTARPAPRRERPRWLWPALARGAAARPLSGADLSDDFLDDDEAEGGGGPSTGGGGSTGSGGDLSDEDEALDDAFEETP